VGCIMPSRAKANSKFTSASALISLTGIIYLCFLHRRQKVINSLSDPTTRPRKRRRENSPRGKLEPLKEVGRGRMLILSLIHNVDFTHISNYQPSDFIRFFSWVYKQVSKGQPAISSCHS
jgi:hypothetical protein